MEVAPLEDDTTVYLAYLVGLDISPQAGPEGRHGVIDLAYSEENRHAKKTFSFPVKFGKRHHVFECFFPNMQTLNRTSTDFIRFPCRDHDW